MVHAHGIDAVFSVIYRSCTVEEAFAEAADNVRLASRNIAAVIRLSLDLRISEHAPRLPSKSVA